MKKKNNKTIDKNIEYYMSLNYKFVVEKFNENRVTKYGLKIPELPGVWSSGTTLAEAYEELEDAKRLWFETCLQEGIEIFEPVSEEDFSGKFVLRIDPQLHMTLHNTAVMSRTSLNQHVRNLLENQITIIEIINSINNLNHKMSLIDEKINSLAEVMSNYLRPSGRSFLTPFQPTVMAGYDTYVNQSNPCWNGAFVTLQCNTSNLAELENSEIQK